MGIFLCAVLVLGFASGFASVKVSESTHLITKESYDTNWSHLNVTCLHGFSQAQNDVRVEETSKGHRNFYSRPTRALSKTDDDDDDDDVSSEEKEELSPVSSLERNKNSSISSLGLSAPLQRVLPETSRSLVTLAPGEVSGLDTAKEKVRLSVSSCSHLELGPEAVDGNVHKLSLESDGIIFLHVHWAVSSRNLSEVYIAARSGVRGLETCGWWPQSINTLDISHSLVKSLTFSGCTSPPSTLSHILATGASLAEVRLCTPNVTYLEVSWNSLNETSHMVDCIGGLSKLQELHASNNRLLSFSSCGLDSLQHLDLSHNNLATLNFSTCSVPRLSTLKASFNRLHSVSQLPSSLVTLDFSHNQFSYVPHLTGELNEVDFSKNKIETLGDQMFLHAGKLYKLDLSHNFIKHISNRQMQGLSELRELDLSSNRISSISFHAFSRLDNINHIKLQNNRLTALQPPLLHGLPLHTRVELHGNPWKCSCQLIVLLKKASKRHCHPYCPKKGHVITCVESDHEVPAHKMLKSCHVAAKNAKHASVVSNTRPPEEGSDEDTSQETSSSPSRKGIMAIPAVLVIALVSAFLFMLYRLYHKRRNVRRYLSHLACCNRCFGMTKIADKPSDLDKDSDSEMELEATRPS